MQTNSKNILLIGPVPSPAGGVSVHLWRLKHLLGGDFNIDLVDESRNVKPGFFNIRKFNLFGYLNRVYKSDILSIHSGLNSLRFFHIIAGKILRKKIVLTIHAYPKEKKIFFRKIDECLFGSCDSIISVNNEILTRISLPAKKTIVQYAFLPPVLSEEKPLPLSVQALVQNSRSKGEYMIVSNAWRLDRFNEQDVYGVDMCIGAMKTLREKGVPVHFIFNVATIDMFAGQFEQYQTMIRQAGLEDCFSLINEELSFVKLMEQADLVVRPTNTDGDSLTIWEAIYLEKPIISSDVVKRPAGTILFRNRDQQDFEEKIVEALDNIEHLVSTRGTISYEYFKNLYSNLFGKLINNS